MVKSFSRSISGALSLTLSMRIVRFIESPRELLLPMPKESFTLTLHVILL